MSFKQSKNEPKVDAHLNNVDPRNFLAFDSGKGVAMVARVIFPGELLGSDPSKHWDEGQSLGPGIEFYDASQRGKPEQGPFGQRKNEYYLGTLLGTEGYGGDDSLVTGQEALKLNGGRPEYDITGNVIQEVLEWAQKVVAGFDLSLEQLKINQSFGNGPALVEAPAGLGKGLRQAAAIEQASDNLVSLKHDGTPAAPISLRRQVRGVEPVKPWDALMNAGLPIADVGNKAGWSWSTRTSIPGSIFEWEGANDHRNPSEALQDRDKAVQALQDAGFCTCAMMWDKPVHEQPIVAFRPEDLGMMPADLAEKFIVGWGAGIKPATKDAYGLPTVFGLMGTETHLKNPLECGQNPDLYLRQEDHVYEFTWDQARFEANTATFQHLVDGNGGGWVISDHYSNPTEELPYEIVWFGEWKTDLIGEFEARAHVAKSNEGFHPALEISQRGGDSGEPGYGEAFPTMEAAKAEAKARLERWQQLED